MQTWRRAEPRGSAWAISEFYLVLAPDLTIVGASDGFLDATMNRREDVVGRHLFQVFPERADVEVGSNSDLAASVIRTWRLKRPDGMTLQKYALARRDRVPEERYLSVLHVPVLAPGGGLQWIIQRIEDVTDVTAPPIERAAHQAAMDQERPPAGRAVQLSQSGRWTRLPSSALAEIAHLDEEGQLAAAIARELRQPLSAISSYLSAARRCLQRGDVEIAATAIEKAHEQLRRTGQVFRGLGDFVRKVEARQRIEPLPQVIREGIAIALPDTSIGAVDLSIAFDATAASAVIDRASIQQVVAHLIRNAVEAMDGRASRSLSISTRCHAHDMIQISIGDDGPGVEVDIRKRIFQPFVTSKPGKVGLGLSISRAIVEAHGGVLWVEDAPAGGAIVRFTVPSADAKWARAAAN